MAPPRWIWSNSLQPFSRRKEEAGGGGEQIPLTLIGSSPLLPFSTRWNISRLLSVPSLDLGVEMANKARTRSSLTEIIIFWSRQMKDFYIVTGCWFYAMKGGTSLAYSYVLESTVCRPRGTHVCAQKAAFSQLLPIYHQTEKIPLLNIFSLCSGWHQGPDSCTHADASGAPLAGTLQPGCGLFPTEAQCQPQHLWALHRLWEKLC